MSMDSTSGFVELATGDDLAPAEADAVQGHVCGCRVRLLQSCSAPSAALAHVVVGPPQMKRFGEPRARVDAFSRSMSHSGIGGPLGADILWRESS